MKTWIKGGLIGIGIGALDLLLLFVPVKFLYYLSSPLCAIISKMNNPESFAFCWMMGGQASNLIIGFIIGALIGWIVGKVKSKDNFKHGE